MRRLVFTALVCAFFISSSIAKPDNSGHGDENDHGYTGNNPGLGNEKPALIWGQCFKNADCHKQFIGKEKGRMVECVGGKHGRFWRIGKCVCMTPGYNFIDGQCLPGTVTPLPVTSPSPSPVASPPAAASSPSPAAKVPSPAPTPSPTTVEPVPAPSPA